MLNEFSFVPGSPLGCDETWSTKCLLTFRRHISFPSSGRVETICNHQQNHNLEDQKLILTQREPKYITGVSLVAVFWVVATCSLVEVYKHFRGREWQSSP